jgi:hypothetical protein
LIQKSVKPCYSHLGEQHLDSSERVAVHAAGVGAAVLAVLPLDRSEREELHDRHGGRLGDPPGPERAFLLSIPGIDGKTKPWAFTRTRKQLTVSDLLSATTEQPDSDTRQSPR